VSRSQHAGKALSALDQGNSLVSFNYLAATMAGGCSEEVHVRGLQGILSRAKKWLSRFMAALHRQSGRSN
jgi:hypothetical protein